jgi:hypothetical protein
VRKVAAAKIRFSDLLARAREFATQAKMTPECSDGATSCVMRAAEPIGSSAFGRFSTRRANLTLSLAIRITGLGRRGESDFPD